MNKDLALLPYFLDRFDPSRPLGNPHHGIVDGTTLADGSPGGIVHVALTPYAQNSRLWVTPCFDVVVPGHSFTPPASPPAGVTWLDHAILSGSTGVLYGKIAGANLVSFGVGDTWQFTLQSYSITHDASGDSASVTVLLTPFGRFGISPVPADIALTSNLLNPSGQPADGSLSGDWPAGTAIKLMPYDVSQNGQKIILAVVENDPLYKGFTAPRGFMLLELSKTSATLSLLKTRSEMLVTVNQTISQTIIPDTGDYTCSTSPTVVTHQASSSDTTVAATASNIMAAYFDSSGAVEYLRYEINSSYHHVSNIAAWTETCISCVSGTASSCSLDNGQTITQSQNVTYNATVNIVRVSDSAVIRSANINASNSASGNFTTSGGKFDLNDSWTETYGGTTLGGTSISVSTPGSYSATGLSGPFQNQRGVAILYQDYMNQGLGSTTFYTHPGDFSDISSPSPVSQIGTLGLIGHEILWHSVETFIGAVRRGQYAALPCVEMQGLVVCAHPRTGQIIHKVATYGSIPAPSYGWV